MNASLVILASNWYQELMKSIPDGQNFSLRSVFDALPRIIEKLPTTLFLTLEDVCVAEFEFELSTTV